MANRVEVGLCPEDIVGGGSQSRHLSQMVGKGDRWGDGGYARRGGKVGRIRCVGVFSVVRRVRMRGDRGDGGGCTGWMLEGAQCLKCLSSLRKLLWGRASAPGCRSSSPNP